MKLKLLLISFLFLLLTISCTRTPSITLNKIQGRWILQDSKAIDFGEISFLKDSVSYFSSRADTIYRFKYYLKGSNLILIDPFNQKNLKTNQIIKLNKKELVFRSLWYKKAPQSYKRYTKRR